MKLHKFLKFIAMAAMAVSVWAAPALADEEDPVAVWVDNEIIEFDQPPVLLNGRTMVPLRAVFEKAGATVEWDGATSTAILTRGNYNVTVKLGEAFITKNGVPVAIDTPSTLINERTLIPVRAIAEAMDFGVTWNPVYGSVLISTNTKEYRANSQWKTGFKPLQDFGFYVESSVSDLKFDISGDGVEDVINFTQADTEKAKFSINGTDYSEIVNNFCTAPFAIGIVDVIEKDRFQEIMLVDSSGGILTAYFFRYNGFDLFELKVAQEGVSGIDFNETLFFDGIENIISDLDGLCFLDTMVCPGIYSLEQDEIKRYYLDCKNSIDRIYSPKYNDNMAYSIYYTNAYIAGEYINGEDIEPESIMVSELPPSIKILDMYMDSSDPSRFEFYVEFGDGTHAVIWPYNL